MLPTLRSLVAASSEIIVTRDLTNPASSWPWVANSIHRLRMFRSIRHLDLCGVTTGTSGAGDGRRRREARSEGAIGSSRPHGSSGACFSYFCLLGACSESSVYVLTRAASLIFISDFNAIGGHDKRKTARAFVMLFVTYACNVSGLTNAGNYNNVQSVWLKRFGFEAVGINRRSITGEALGPKL
jgi:hypothetical protein